MFPDQKASQGFDKVSALRGGKAIPDEKTEVKRVCDEALSWLGSRHVHRCAVKGLGIDCALLIKEAFKPVANSAMRVPFYSEDFMLHKGADVEPLLSELKNHFIEVNVPARGNVVVFKIGRCYSHSGIMLTERTFIHSLVKVGVTCSQLVDDLWIKRERKFFRLNKWAQRIS